MLALQGAFHLHVQAIGDLGHTGRQIRLAHELDAVDALILPGGESTAMSLLLGSNELTDPVTKLVKDGLPTFGTCAGMILLAIDVLDGRPDQVQVGVLDISVRRNGYGRQLASFEADMVVPELGIEAEDPFRAVFVRAPRVERVGPEVTVLATVDDDPALVRSGSILASAFHPELTPDLRLHRYFVDELVG